MRVDTCVYAPMHKESWETTCWCEGRKVAAPLPSPTGCLRHYRTWPHDAEMCGRRTEPWLRRHYLGFAPLVPAFTDYFKFPFLSPQWLHSYSINVFPEPHVCFACLVMLVMSQLCSRVSSQLSPRPCIPSSPICQGVHQRQSDFVGAGGATKLSVTGVLNPFMENSKRQVN
jgi:hypothetical protein